MEKKYIKVFFYVFCLLIMFKINHSEDLTDSRYVNAQTEPSIYSNAYDDRHIEKITESGWTNRIFHAINHSFGWKFDDEDGLRIEDHHIHYEPKEWYTEKFIGGKDHYYIQIHSFYTNFQTNLARITIFYEKEFVDENEMYDIFDKFVRIIYPSLSSEDTNLMFKTLLTEYIDSSYDSARIQKDNLYIDYKDDNEFVFTVFITDLVESGEVENLSGVD